MSARLDSWKEIAAHFGRQVRTVQRWERDEGLPVHRHAHLRRGNVYAWTAELDAWLASRQVAPGALEDELDKGHPSTAIEERTPRGEGSEVPVAAAAVPRRTPRTPLLAALLLIALAGGTLLTGKLANSASDNSGDPDWALSARYLLNRGSRAEIERALELCAAQQEAGLTRVARAALHECVAAGTLALVRLGAVPGTDGLPRALAEADRALAIEPHRALAATTAARIRFLADWDAATAERALRAASAASPAAPEPHHALAQLLSIRGRHDEAIAELRAAQRGAPLSAAINDDGCWFFYRARRAREAIVEAQRALVLEPDRPGALECIVDSRLALGELTAARQAAVLLMRGAGDSADAAAIQAALPAEIPGLIRAWQLRRAETFKEPGSGRAPAGLMAYAYAQAGKLEDALAALDRAARARDSWLLLVRVHPAFDALRTDPRLEPLLRRAGV